MLDSTREGPSLLPQTVKNLPAMQETQVRSLGGKDALEKEMATRSRIPWTESLVGYGPWDRRVTGLSDRHFHRRQGGREGGEGAGRKRRGAERRRERIPGDLRACGCP